MRTRYPGSNGHRSERHKRPMRPPAPHPDLIKFADAAAEVVSKETRARDQRVADAVVRDRQRAAALDPRQRARGAADERGAAEAKARHGAPSGEEGVNARRDGWRAG